MQELLVPLIKQGKLECGPASLKMVLRYFGVEISIDEIIKKIGGIKRYGVKTIRLADFAQKSGFKVYCYSYNIKLPKGNVEIRKPTKSDIIKFLKKGIPVIIVVRQSLLFNEKLSSTGHFIVITKYENGRFWYNDPEDGKRHKIKEEDLMFAWYNHVIESSAYLLVLQLKR